MLKIAIDFDGTCVKHAFPELGTDLPGAVKVLKRLADAGHMLILYTMRSGSGKWGHTLPDAMAWFDRHRIPLYAVQTDPPQKIWTNSPKCYADLYIDDSALGVPLKIDQGEGERPYVDWEKAEYLLIQRGVLPTANTCSQSEEEEDDVL